MSTNQLHGKKFEIMILDFFNTKERGNTTMFDIPYNFNGKYGVGSIKTAKYSNNPKLWLSDARRVFSWFDTLSLHNSKAGIYLIIGVYEQNDNIKSINTVYEFYLKNTDEVKQILYGNLTLSHITAFHNAIGLDFFDEGEYEKARLFAKKTNEALNKYSGILKLHPKIDSKRQRRLQCSISLNELLFYVQDQKHKDIQCKIYTTKFLNYQLPILINSGSRELKSKNK